MQCINARLYFNTFMLTRHPHKLVTYKSSILVCKTQQKVIILNFSFFILILYVYNFLLIWLNIIKAFCAHHVNLLGISSNLFLWWMDWVFFCGAWRELASSRILCGYTLLAIYLILPKLFGKNWFLEWIYHILFKINFLQPFKNFFFY